MAFLKVTQLISNGARSRSQASWFQPHILSIQGTDMRENLVKPRHAPHMWQDAMSTHLFCLVVPTPLLDNPNHTGPILPFASTASLPTCSQLYILSTGHPRGEQAHHGSRGGGHAQIPSPPVQNGPGQGTSISMRFPVGQAVGTEHRLCPGETLKLVMMQALLYNYGVIQL